MRSASGREYARNIRNEPFLKMTVVAGIAVLTLMEPCDNIEAVTIMPPYVIPVSVERPPHVHGARYPSLIFNSVASGAASGGVVGTVNSVQAPQRGKAIGHVINPD
jgi:hypothetical protein